MKRVMFIGVGLTMIISLVVLLLVDMKQKHDTEHKLDLIAWVTSDLKDKMSKDDDYSGITLDSVGLEKSDSNKWVGQANYSLHINGQVKYQSSQVIVTEDGDSKQYDTQGPGQLVAEKQMLQPQTYSIE